MKLKNFFCQFPNPWTLRVSGMGGYTSKCEKKSKSLHPNARILSTSFISVSIFSVWCYSSVSISMARSLPMYTVTVSHKMRQCTVSSSQHSLLPCLISLSFFFFVNTKVIRHTMRRVYSVRPAGLCQAFPNLRPGS